MLPLNPGQRFGLVLVLYSYDLATRQVVDKLKNELSSGLMGFSQTFLVFGLSDVELFKVEVEASRHILGIIAEVYGDSATLYWILGTSIVDVETIELGKSGLDSRVRAHVRKKIEGTAILLAPLEKLEILSNLAGLILFIRDRELTRGGEFVELVYLLAQPKVAIERVWFLKREGFDLSEMALEILDRASVNMRTYSSDVRLFREAVRITKLWAMKAPIE